MGCVISYNLLHKAIKASSKKCHKPRGGSRWDTCASSLTFHKTRMLQNKYGENVSNSEQGYSVAFVVYSFVKYSTDITHFIAKLAQFYYFQNCLFPLWGNPRGTTPGNGKCLMESVFICQVWRVGRVSTSIIKLLENFSMDLCWSTTRREFHLKQRLWVSKL